MMFLAACTNTELAACKMLIAPCYHDGQPAHGPSFLRRLKLAAKEQELAAATSDVEAVEAEAASMASAYDGDRAALEKQRQALLHAQEERTHLLEQLAARRSQASEAVTSAQQECQQLTSEVNGRRCASMWDHSA